MPTPSQTRALQEILGYGKFIWRKGGVYILGALLLFAGVAYFAIRHLGGSDTTIRVLTYVIGPLFYFLLFGWFFQYLQNLRIDDQIRDTLARLFSGADQNVFRALSDQARQDIVEKSLKASLGDEYGDRLYLELVRGYMSREKDFRSDYRYIITCLDSPRLPEPNVQEIEPLLARLRDNAHQYTWIAQDISFKRNGYSADRNEESLYFNFALSGDQLNEFFSHDAIFFREVLQFDTEVRNLVLNLSQPELLFFVRDVLRFRAKDIEKADMELPYSVVWENTPHRGKYIRIVIKNPSGRLEGSGCGITFELPHFRQSSYFIVTMPRPIKTGAQITFNRNHSMMQLQPVIYLDREAYDEKVTPPESPDPQTIQVNTRKWVFPRGGITFVWRYH
jgi:hypothetical protein